MASIPESYINELLRRVDVVEIVGRRLPLKRAGREYRARCPFHDERTPSFWVSPQKQFFHCFGCGAHGSAIGFVMKYDGLDFRDAVEVLAQQAGLAPPPTGGRSEPGDTRQDYTLLDAAARWFQQQLKGEPRAQQYLAGRGLSADMIEQFGVGFAPGDGDLLVQALGLGPERRETLKAHGLLAEGQRGLYAKFRDRIMFPIADRRGRTIAFGGRVLGDGQPKYLNSPETALFHKGRELYGLWQARQRREELKRLIVVEGYLDVIALAQAGLPGAVATLGTATTREQAELLFRNADDVVFCFDGDRAGKQAAWRALTQVLPRMREGRQAFFLFLPDGEDPDSLIRREGREAFEHRLHREAIPSSRYFFAELERDCDLATHEGKARLAARARPMLSEVPDGSYRDLMRAELERKVGTAVSLQSPESKPATARPRGGAAQPSLVRHAIEALLLYPPGVRALPPPPWGFEGLDRAGVDLLERLLHHIRDHDIEHGSELLRAFEEDAAHPALLKLYSGGASAKPESLAGTLVESIQRLAEESRRERRSALAARADRGELSAEESAELRRLLRPDR
ncbi:MAG: DNA primase [Xanthomonadales bacterium]|jgi:DNA primase|nr:DNA primase [Xanthomonadales bacterium]